VPRSVPDGVLPAATTSAAYQISSVGRALTILEAFGTREELTVSEAARMLGVAPSTAHRILQMLLFHGFVVQGVRREYRRGPSLGRFAEAPAATSPESDGSDGIDRSPSRLNDQLTALRDELHANVRLMTLEGNGARFLLGARNRHHDDVNDGGRTGWLLPAHTVAGGKVLLAGLDHEALAALYPTEVPSTRHGRIISLSQLQREIRTVRREGFARSIGEATEFVAALAVAVPGSQLSISVSWPRPSYPHADERKIVETLRAGAHRLAGVMAAGHRFSTGRNA
jgi:IclR family transcriptional regulator, acetate operon repressor